MFTSSQTNKNGSAFRQVSLSGCPSTYSWRYQSPCAKMRVWFWSWGISPSSVAFCLWWPSVALGKASWRGCWNPPQCLESFLCLLWSFPFHLRCHVHQGAWDPCLEPTCPVSTLGLGCWRVAPWAGIVCLEPECFGPHGPTWSMAKSMVYFSWQKLEWLLNKRHQTHPHLTKTYQNIQQLHPKKHQICQKTSIFPTIVRFPASRSECPWLDSGVPPAHAPRHAAGWPPPCRRGNAPGRDRRFAPVGLPASFSPKCWTKYNMFMNNMFVSVIFTLCLVPHLFPNILQEIYGCLSQLPKKGASSL